MNLVSAILLASAFSLCTASAAPAAEGPPGAGTECLRPLSAGRGADDPGHGPPPRLMPFPPPGTAEMRPPRAAAGWRADPLERAAQINAVATAIGIRADQFDAWRAFTDALQAVTAPPPPPDRSKPAAPGTGLAEIADFAGHIAEKGRQAADLASAVEALRGRLSSEQMARLDSLGPVLTVALLPPPPPPPLPRSERRGPPAGGPDGPHFSGPMGPEVPGRGLSPP